MEITAFARGFLALVGALEQGKGLSQGGDVLQPVVHLNDQLGLGFRSQEVQLGSTFATDTYGPLFTVPNGRIWKVIAYGAYLTNAAGVTNDGVHLEVCSGQNGAAAQAYAAISEEIAFGVSSVGSLAARNLPMWLKGGDSLGAYGRWAGGNTVFNAAVLFEEYPG